MSNSQHSNPNTINSLQGGGRIDYAGALNPAQLAAVAHDEGPLLVIAGAGSGKTRTLTYRVARLVEDGVRPRSILLLSFTRKAAQEMLRRAAELLDSRCREVAGGTFHSFAYHELRSNAPKLGFPKGFTILDRTDAEDLIGLIRKEITPGEDCGLPRKATLAAMFSRSVNKSLALEEVIYNDYPHFCSQLQLINEIWMKYSQRKIEHAFCDYDDLLVYFYRLLCDDHSVRMKLSSSFSHILVDEYQDTNLIQAEIISLLAGPQRNVMVVGDDSQSIYAFRGASFKNIITFPERFPGTRIIKLEENYRSVQPILDLTNQIIEHAAEKYTKRLFTRRGGGRRPLVMATRDENAQSRYICAEIARWVRQGVPLNDIAVLFRASFHSFDLELELTRLKIPFVKYGGFKFAESAHIKDLLAHMRIMAAPNDRISWQRALMLIDKVGPKSAQRVFELVSDQGRGAEGLLNAPIKGKISTALNPLKELVAALGAPMLSVQQMGELILQYYSPLLMERFDDYPRRQRDLEQLLSIMTRYENVGDFLADMALEPPNTSSGDQLTVTPDSSDRLTLSTIHSAKGLEWHTVFIIWTLDGRFPSQLTVNNPEELEEERRLMYVAATRARENLIFTYPAQVYDRISNSVLFKPSRFLDEIPTELMDCRFYNPYAQ